MKKCLVSLASLFISLSLIGTTFAQAATTVTVKVCQDNTYQTMYKGTSNMVDTWNNMTYPFVNKWGLTLSHSIYNINSNVVATDKCPLGTSQECTTSSCGSVCTNDYITSQNHQKIFTPSFIRPRIWDGVVATIYYYV